MKKLALVIISLALAACGGGGGGGSSSGGGYTTILKAPQMKCGEMDCVTGARASSFTQALAAGDQYDLFKDEYAHMKHVLSRVQEEVNNFNRLASGEDISNCSEIPTSGTFTIPGQKVTELILDVGSEGFDLGSGMVNMSHKIIIETDGIPSLEMQFACVGNKQTIHLLSSGTVNASDKVLFEAYYEIDTGSGSTKLQFAEVFGSDYRTMASFKSSGGSDFDLTGITNYGGSSYVSVSAKTLDDTPVTSGTFLEYVYSPNIGANLDAIGFGSSSGEERVCATNYKGALPSIGTHSCDDPLNPSAPATALVPDSNLLGQSGSPAWNTTYLNDIDIRDLLNRP